MLGKLMKHEWRGVCKVGLLMLLLIAVVTFFGWLAFQTPMWQSLASDNSYNGEISPLDIMSFVTLFMYVIMLVGISYGILIYLGVHFYRTMYTEEGYLTHTLPVSKWKLLNSKVLVGSIWCLIVTLAVWASVMVLAFSLIGAVTPDMPWGEIWRDLVDNWAQIKGEIADAFGVEVSRWFILSVISLLVQPICSVVILFGAISMGQLFTKHRVLMAIVMYVVILIISMMIGSGIQSITSMNVITDMMAGSGTVGTYMDTTTISSLIQNTIIAAILYVTSYLVIDKKLNME